MATKTCYHWDVRATGECPTCHTSLTVAQTTSVRVGFGDGETLSGYVTLDYTPTVRDALAWALGISDDDISLIDVEPILDRYGETGWQVTFSLTGSKVRVRAMVRLTQSTKRTPESAEYEEVEA
jgi:hypothetical protein